MGSVNKVIIVGNLGVDPDVRYMPDGNAVATLSVATSSRYKDKKTGEAKQTTEWHRIVFFKRKAEVVKEYLKKGSEIYVEGKLKTRKWVGNDGQDRYTTEIVGYDLQMLGKKEPSTVSAPPVSEEPPRDNFADYEDDLDGDIPF